MIVQAFTDLAIPMGGRWTADGRCDKTVCGLALDTTPRQHALKNGILAKVKGKLMFFVQQPITLNLWGVLKSQSKTNYCLTPKKG